MHGQQNVKIYIEVPTVSTRIAELYLTIHYGWSSGQCVRLTTLPPSCAVVVKSGNLNFLEPSGPLQACNGTALPLPLLLSVLLHSYWRHGREMPVLVISNP